MKILHIVSSGYPYISGYTLRSENILNALMNFGIDIDVVVSIFNKRYEQLKNGRNFIYNNRKYYQILSNRLIWFFQIIEKLPKMRLLFHYSYVFLNSLLIILQVDIKKYDIINGHSTFLNGMSSLIIAKIFRKKFVYDIHAFGFMAYSKHGFRYRFEKSLECFIMKRSDGLIVIDEYLKIFICEEFKYPGNKIFVTPNGINSKTFKKIKKNYGILRELGISDSKFLIGIDNSKELEGFKFILDNLQLFIKNFPNIYFLVFGSKSKKDRDISSITYLPNIDYKNMPVYYNLIDLFVMPRIKNNQTETVTPLKILEIMSCEKPVLVSDVGGLTICVKHNKTGFIYKEGDIKDFNFKLRNILNKKSVDRICKNARIWVEKNKSWNDTASQYISCYRSI